MNEGKRAAIYVRVSTVGQETHLQEAELKEYCERRGWTFVVYRDHGQSGVTQDRPALNALFSDLRKRNFDVLVVAALDRLTRSVNQLLTISDECMSLGVDLVSLNEGVDATSPEGRSKLAKMLGRYRRLA